ATSCVAWSIVASAPSARARSSLRSLPAVAMTRAPSKRAIWIAALPTPLPAPITSTSSPGASFARPTSMCHAVRTPSGMAAAAPPQVELIDPTRAHLHDHVQGPGARIGQVAIFEPFRAAIAVEPARFHAGARAGGGMIFGVRPAPPAGEGMVIPAAHAGDA